MLFPLCTFCSGRTNDSPAAVFNAIELTADSQPLRIGYHDSTDDSVSSSTWTAPQGRNRHIKALVSDPEVRSAWVRCYRDTAHYFKEPVR